MQAYVYGEKRPLLGEPHDVVSNAGSTGTMRRAVSLCTGLVMDGDDILAEQHATKPVAASSQAA